MLCADFESRLTDYLDGVLDAETSRLLAEHVLRCPVCHETFAEVKDAVQACRVAPVPPPTSELEGRILSRTMPETVLTCEGFEESLTDYLDGFLPACQYHRWERHAALCDRCTELPGEVVRTIGACYTYISEEKPVPAGLNQRILEATLSTVIPEEVRAPFASRLASRLRLWLDPIVSPQLATVATMLLVAVFVLTNTVSADGSISGMYRASLRLAEQSYVSGASNGVRGIANGLRDIVGAQPQSSPSNNNSQKPDNGAPQKENGSNSNQRNNP